MPEDNAIGITFALTATAEELDEDDTRPCAYCNPTERVEEREYCAQQKYPNEDLPDDVGIVSADFILRFGHEDGAGVEVPACDSCLVDAPIEHADQTTHTELDFRYFGDGEIRRHVVEQSDGQTVHRKVPVEE